MPPLAFSPLLCLCLASALPVSGPRGRLLSCLVRTRPRARFLARTQQTPQPHFTGPRGPRLRSFRWVSVFHFTPKGNGTRRVFPWNASRCRWHETHRATTALRIFAQSCRALPSGPLWWSATSRGHSPCPPRVSRTWLGVRWSPLRGWKWCSSYTQAETPELAGPAPRRRTSGSADTPCSWRPGSRRGVPGASRSAPAGASARSAARRAPVAPGGAWHAGRPAPSGGRRRPAAPRAGPTSTSAPWRPLSPEYCGRILLLPLPLFLPPVPVPRAFRQKAAGRHRPQDNPRPRGNAPASAQE